MSVAIGRSISHGAAYSEYSQKKDENGVITATFVGAKNMVGNTDLIFDDTQLDDMWIELKEAGRDYVRKGKDVTRDVFVIEWSPSEKESQGWTKDDWFRYAEELIAEIDKIQLKKTKRDPKTKKWILDENGKKKKFPVPKTDLQNSKWVAYLHKDSKSGILHLHIIISRYKEDGKTLNCDTDFAKKAAQASETLNEKYGWTKAMDIRQQHIEEILNNLGFGLTGMNAEEINLDDFKEMVESITFTDYKGKQQHYTVQFHPDGNGNYGYTIGRGKSIFKASELGLKITNIPAEHKTSLKDMTYAILRNMDGNAFDWKKFVKMMEANNRCQVLLKRDSRGFVVNYSVVYGGKKYNASQIGPKLTAKKIVGEWERIQDEQEKAKAEQERKAKLQQQAEEKNKIQKQTLSEGLESSRTLFSEKTKIIKQYTPHTPTDGEKERNDAIRRGQNAIVDARNSWHHNFSLYDAEDILPAAIAAKAIEMGQSPNDWSSNLALNEAKDELLKGVAMPDTVQDEIGRSLTAIILDMVLPANVGSFGGGGSNNDLPRKKDDDWFAWKNYGFTKKQRGHGVRR